MAEGIPPYDELKLRIEKGTEGNYRALAIAPDGSTAQGEFTLPFDETMLENFVLRVGRPRRGTRGGYGSAEMEAAQRFGSQLFQALFAAGVGDVYHRARERADFEDKGLRVTLYLSGVPELQHIPWEFLYEWPMFLAHSIETPVVRSLDLESVRRPRKVQLPLRILGVDSRPHGNAPLDADQERHNLEQAVRSLQDDGMVELEWLERATLRELQRALDRRDDFHVLHYIGHGAYDERSGTGTLLLEARDGTTHQVPGAELGSVLYDERSLRLAVLNACEGARVSHRDPFSGVASSLVACGIPAVVGMQFEITDDAAITFAEQLYTSLAEGYPVDACVAQARRAIWADGHDTEFGTPVLFLRGAGGRLFDFDETALPRPRSAPPLSRTPPEVEPRTGVTGQSARPQPRPALSLKLTQSPPEVEPGTEVTWQLTIRNSGNCPLSDVTARRADGAILADPVALAPGREHIVRWTDAAQPEIHQEVTVTAADVDGSQVLDQTSVLPAVRRVPRPAQQWSASVVSRSRMSRSFSVQLTKSSHAVNYHASLVKGVLELDGEVVATVSALSTLPGSSEEGAGTMRNEGTHSIETYPFAVADGDTSYQGVFEVRHAALGKILAASLTVNSQMLYRE